MDAYRVLIKKSAVLILSSCEIFIELSRRMFSLKIQAALARKLQCMLMAVLGSPLLHLADHAQQASSI